MNKEELLAGIDRKIALYQSQAESYEREVRESQAGADRARENLRKLYTKRNQLMNLELNFNLPDQ